MKKKIFAFLAIFSALYIASCSKVEDSAISSQEENLNSDVTASEEDSSSSIIPGEMIVEFSDEMTARIEASSDPCLLLGGMDIISVERLYEYSEEWEERHRAAGLHKWYRIKYNAAQSYTKASSDARDIDGVVYVEPVRRVKSTAIFNDPYLYKQWHYINDGTYGKAGFDIDVEKVWKDYTCGTSDVIVSVVDGGIDLSHPDLSAATIAGGKNGSKNFVDDSYNIVAHDHGTHVAGTIGAINNNGAGVCGIAGGSDGKGGVKLMSCQVFKTNSSTGKDVSASNFGDAMIWGADNGAVISQNSWGYVYDTKDEAAAGSVGSIKTAIEYFIKYAGCDANGKQRSDSPMKGGVVIFAAGNDGWPDGWPAEYSAKQPLCIAVGAFNSDGLKSDFSNYGDWVTICAPGENVLSTLPGSAYGSMNGTSMACPHVSGVAALVVSQCGGAGFTNENLREKLVEGAKYGKISGKIGPMVSALGAVTYGGIEPPEAVQDYEAVTSANFIDFKFKVTSDPDDKKAYAYVLAASKDKSLLTSFNPKNATQGVTTTEILVGDKKVNDEIEGSLEVGEFNTQYYVAVYARDLSANYSASSAVKSVVTKQNNPPLITTDYEGDFRVKAHLTLEVLYNVADPDGHSVKVSFTPGSDAATLEQIPSGEWRLKIVGKSAPAGTYTASIIATESYGLSTTREISYEVLENHAPVIIKQLDNMVFEDVASRKTINMDEYISDEDGEQVVFDVKMSAPGVVKLNQVDNVLNLTTLDYGTTKINITARDACGKSVTMPVGILVRDPKSDPDVYPNPVSDVLKVSDGTSKQISVSLFNSNGALLQTVQGEGSAFDPVTVDMSSYAPGRYNVKVTTSSKSYQQAVVKL